MKEYKDIILIVLIIVLIGGNIGMYYHFSGKLDGNNKSVSDIKKDNKRLRKEVDNLKANSNHMVDTLYIEDSVSLARIEQLEKRAHRAFIEIHKTDEKIKRLDSLYRREPIDFLPEPD